MKDANKKNEKQFLNIKSSDSNNKIVNKNKNKTTMNKNKAVDKSKTAMNKNKTVDKSKTIDKSKSKNIINNKIIYKFSNNNNRNLELKKIERPQITRYGCW